MSVLAKFDKLKQRLTNKVRMSATPVTGFVLGLSGTDSIITLILLCEVAKTEGFRVEAYHYVHTFEKKDRVEVELMPWLRERYEDVVLVTTGTSIADQQIWADLHWRAALDRTWVVSTVNATEKALGTYSIMANSASIAPITSLYKSEVLALCEELGVPEYFIKASRLPDCLCGRDEFAAENIELIDQVLRTEVHKNTTHSLDQIIKAMDYIRDTKRDNDFKSRTPYAV